MSLADLLREMLEMESQNVWENGRTVSRLEGSIVERGEGSEP